MRSSPPADTLFSAYTILWDDSEGPFDYYELERDLEETYTPPNYMHFTLTVPGQGFGTPNVERFFYFRARACGSVNGVAVCSPWSQIARDTNPPGPPP
jgi:hypothetical protein